MGENRELRTPAGPAVDVSSSRAFFASVSPRDGRFHEIGTWAGSRSSRRRTSSAVREPNCSPGPASLGVPHTPFFAPSAIRLGVRTHPKTLPLQRASVDRRRDVPLSLRRKFHSGTVVSLSESQSFERTTLLSLLTFCFLFLSYTSWLQCSLLIFVFTNNTRSDRHGPHNRAFLSLALDTLRLALQAVVSLLPRSCGAGRPHFLPSGLFLSSSSSPRLRFSSEPE